MSSAKARESRSRKGSLTRGVCDVTPVGGEVGIWKPVNPGLDMSGGDIKVGRWWWLDLLLRQESSEDGSRGCYAGHLEEEEPERVPKQEGLSYLVGGVPRNQCRMMRRRDSCRRPE